MSFTLCEDLMWLIGKSVEYKRNYNAVVNEINTTQGYLIYLWCPDSRPKELYNYICECESLSSE